MAYVRKTLFKQPLNLVKNPLYFSYVYWGEYPLSFAACLGQEECYRLILARGADPDKQDTNGNTVLHMLVIYEKVVSKRRCGSFVIYLIVNKDVESHTYLWYMVLDC